MVHRVFELLATKRGAVTVTAAFVILLVVGLIVPLPSAGREIDAVCNTLHVVCFAGLGALVLIIVRIYHRRPGLVWVLTCFGLITLFGLATEFVQPLFGRNASWGDVWADACGALVGILMVTAITATSQLARIAMYFVAGATFLAGMADPILVLADASLQRLQMPSIGSFEQPLELTRWWWRDCHVERVRTHATDGDWSIRVDLLPGQYPGVRMVHPVRNWSNYSKLTMELHLVGSSPLNVIVRINDKQHSGETRDRFNYSELLLPGRNRIDIDLADVMAAPQGRQMDLSRISKLIVFAESLETPRTFYLDNIRLQ